MQWGNRLTMGVLSTMTGNMENNVSIYQENGYENRRDYLESLADELGIDVNIVFMAASLLGPSEDFDGLVSTLQDEYA